MKKPRIIKSQIHMRHLLDRLCIYPLQHDPTSLTLSTVWHNLQIIHYQSIGQQSKEFFDTLKGTKNYFLTYGGSEEILNQNLNIFCDADWAADANRKSVSGYVITLAGGAVAWSSKKQATVALSTAESEYISATHAAKQVLWHRSLFTELEIKLPRTSTIFSDN